MIYDRLIETDEDEEAAGEAEGRRPGSAGLLRLKEAFDRG
jgi:hypothetical protein